MQIRDVSPADIPAITRLYAEAVLHGKATFELKPPDDAEMATRMQALKADRMPCLVAIDDDGALLGYAYAALFRPRPAYRFTVEDSIYVDPRHHRRGVGRALLGRLIDAATACGFRQMIAAIGDKANDGSIGLHEALGFERAGSYRTVGWKHGQWLDVVLMQRVLGDGASTPPVERPD